MAKTLFIVAKEYGREKRQSYHLPGGRHVSVMPREQFERACAAAGQKLLEVRVGTRRNIWNELEKNSYGI